MLNSGYKKPTVINTNLPVLEKVQSAVATPATFTTSCVPFKAIEEIFYQMQQPDCVENGVTWAKKFLDWRLAGAQATTPITDLSRRSLVVPTVIADGFPYSEGTNVQTAIEQAGNVGISESQYFTDDHTLDPTTFSATPLSPEAVANALTHKLNSNYAMLSDLSVQGLKNAIYQNGFVIIGMDVNAQMWTAPSGQVSWAAADVLPLRVPTITYPVESGHCVVLYAYDEQYFYFFNWWSADWGEEGRGWFGYDYVSQITEAAVVSDFTTPAPEEPQNNQVQAKPSFLQEVETIIEEVEKAL